MIVRRIKKLFSNKRREARPNNRYTTVMIKIENGKLNKMNELDRATAATIYDLRILGMIATKPAPEEKSKWLFSIRDPEEDLQKESRVRYIEKDDTKVRIFNLTDLDRYEKTDSEGYYRITSSGTRYISRSKRDY